MVSPVRSPSHSVTINPPPPQKTIVWSPQLELNSPQTNSLNESFGCRWTWKIGVVDTNKKICDFLYHIDRLQSASVQIWCLLAHSTFCAALSNFLCKSTLLQIFIVFSSFHNVRSEPSWDDFQPLTAKIAVQFVTSFHRQRMTFVSGTSSIEYFSNRCFDTTLYGH